MRNRVDILQGDHAISKQATGPPSGAIRWGTTGQGDQAGFPNTIKDAIVLAPGRFPLQCGVHALPHGCLAHACDRRHAHIQGGMDHGIRPGWSIGACVSFQEDPCMGDRMGGRRSGGYERLQTGTLRQRQLHLKHFLRHLGSPSMCKRVATPGRIPEHWLLFKRALTDY